MQSGKVVKKTLDALPFDGDKTKLGVIGTVYGLAASAFPFAIPIPTDPVTFIITSVATLALGQIHKWLKKKYPEVKWPENKYLDDE